MALRENENLTFPTFLLVCTVCFPIGNGPSSFTQHFDTMYKRWVALRENEILSKPTFRPFRSICFVHAQDEWLFVKTQNSMFWHVGPCIISVIKKLIKFCPWNSARMVECDVLEPKSEKNRNWKKCQFRHKCLFVKTVTVCPLREKHWCMMRYGYRHPNPVFNKHCVSIRWTN